MNADVAYEEYKLEIKGNSLASSLVTLRDFQVIPKRISRVHAESGTTLPYTDGGKDQIIVHVKNTEDRYVLFNDTFHPGWKAYIDGEEVPVARANYAFMGMFVPKISDELRLSFEPAWLDWVKH